MCELGVESLQQAQGDVAVLLGLRQQAAVTDLAGDDVGLGNGSVLIVLGLERLQPVLQEILTIPRDNEYRLVDCSPWANRTSPASKRVCLTEFVTRHARSAPLLAPTIVCKS